MSLKNVLITIPQRGDLRHWSQVEPQLRECVDEESFWSFGCRYHPKESGPGALCFVVHSGYVRGYFTILDFFEGTVYRTTPEGGEEEFAGKMVRLVTWRPLPAPLPEHHSFQGFSYTELRG